jgi:hypothetical protein
MELQNETKETKLGIHPTTRQIEGRCTLCDKTFPLLYVYRSHVITVYVCCNG